MGSEAVTNSGEIAPCGLFANHPHCCGVHGDLQCVTVCIFTSVAPRIVSAIGISAKNIGIGNRQYYKMDIGDQLSVSADISDPLSVIGISAKFHMGASLIFTVMLSLIGHAPTQTTSLRPEGWH